MLTSQNEHTVCRNPINTAVTASSSGNLWTPAPVPSLTVTSSLQSVYYLAGKRRFHSNLQNEQKGGRLSEFQSRCWRLPTETQSQHPQYWHSRDRYNTWKSGSVHQCPLPSLSITYHIPEMYVQSHYKKKQHIISDPLLTWQCWLKPHWYQYMGW